MSCAAKCQTWARAMNTVVVIVSRCFISTLRIGPTTIVVLAGGRHGILTGVTKRSPPGDPMTLGNMRANGVRCHHRAILSADSWPDHVPVPSFGPRMVCTGCGIIGADARPYWPEKTPQ